MNNHHLHIKEDSKDGSKKNRKEIEEFWGSSDSHNSNGLKTMAITQS